MIISRASLRTNLTNVKSNYFGETKCQKETINVDSRDGTRPIRIINGKPNSNLRGKNVIGSSDMGYTINKEKVPTESFTSKDKMVWLDINISVPEPLIDIACNKIHELDVIIRKYIQNRTDFNESVHDATNNAIKG